MRTVRPRGRARRVLAIASVAAVAVALGTTVLVSPAHAAPKMTVQGNSDLKGGEKLTIKLSGFTPSNPVAVGMCPTGRKLKGAGDCGPAKDNMSTLTAADATGSVTVQLVVPDKGKNLGNTTGAPAKCPPCSVAAANIQKPSETAAVRLSYAAGGGGNAAAPKSPADEPAADEPAASDTGQDASGGDAVADDSAATTAETGPAETMTTAAVAASLLLLGLMVMVAARYRGAHRRT